FFAIFVLVVASGAALTVFFVGVHRDALAAANKQKVEMVRQSLEEKAKTLAKNGAVTSARSAVEMNFELLQNVMAATAAGQSDIAYAVIEDAEHKIVVHTDKARVGQTLDASQAANDKAGKDVVTREVVGPGGAPLLEAIA